jgi:hypothetical protein
MCVNDAAAINLARSSKVASLHHRLHCATTEGESREMLSSEPSRLSGWKYLAYVVL